MERDALGSSRAPWASARRRLSSAILLVLASSFSSSSTSSREAEGGRGAGDEAGAEGGGGGGVIAPVSTHWSFCIHTNAHSLKSKKQEASWLQEARSTNVHHKLVTRSKNQIKCLTEEEPKTPERFSKFSRCLESSEALRSLSSASFLRRLKSKS